MKRNIEIALLCISLIIGFTACGRTDTEKLAQISGRSETLESKFEAAQTKQVPMSEAETTTVPIADQQTLEYLDIQVKTNKPSNWLEVAKCNVATMNHLLAVARRCVKLDVYNKSYCEGENYQIKIANALSGNPVTKNDVMAELVNSKYPSIWLIVASSDKSSEGALLAVARRCVKLNAYNGLYSEGESNQIEIANALSRNPATKNDVMAELVNSKYPSIWMIAASSDKSSEEALLAVARRCVKLNAYNGLYSEGESNQIEIANALASNPLITKKVMMELVNSNYQSVIDKGHQFVRNNP